MDPESSWPADFLGTLSSQIGDGAVYLPAILGAIVVFVLGWIIGRFARGQVRSFAKASNRFLGRNLPAGAMATVRFSPVMISLLGEIIFWIVVVIAATVALRIAGFGVMAQWLDRVAVYLPNLIAAFVIIVVGFLLSVFVREQLSPFTDAPDAATRRPWIASAAQVLIIVVAVIIGLDQLGVDVGLLIALTVVGGAGVAFTLGATFALGARQYAANLIGIRSARRQLSIGQWLQVDDIQGQIVELSATQVVLDTQHGRVLLPGHYLESKVATVLARGSTEEGQNG